MSNFFHTHSGQSLYRQLIEPLDGISKQSHHGRVCRALPDDDWIQFGVQRVLGSDFSGRGFLERLADQCNMPIQVSTFFESLKSERRFKLLDDIQSHVEQIVNQRSLVSDDPFASIAALANFDILAGDGHYIKKATHDKPIDGKHFASGHFFGLNLRTHAMFSIAQSERGGSRKREHDMHALKRLTVDKLRHGAPKGKQVIWVWDRAGFDARFWLTAKQQHGVYFISRSKSNMDLTTQGLNDYDANDPVNVGVTGDRTVYISSTALRCVDYTCPQTGESYNFLTTLTSKDIAPGVIAMLYKARWDIEKVFDETKQKFGENKSWASSTTAKINHAHFCALTHNLTLLLERKLAQQHKVEHRTDETRRRKHLRKIKEKCTKRGMQISDLWERLYLRATQRGRVFLRWISNNLLKPCPLEDLLGALKRRLGCRPG